MEAGEVDEQALDRALAHTDYRVTDVAHRAGPAPSNGAAADFNYDLVVLGSGGGAFAGAIRARDLGKRVLMVERAVTGGTCVNVGCVPSKKLLVASEQATIPGRPSLMRSPARPRSSTSCDRGSTSICCDDYGIEFRPGHARLAGPHTMMVDGEPISAAAILIATGARPTIPAISGLGEAGYLTSTTALELTHAPARLAVLGAGPVGLELGHMLGNFGSAVTFVARRGVAPDADPEIAEALAHILRDQGHEVIAPATTTTLAVDGAEKVVSGTVSGAPFELRVDEVLVATGRTPNTDGLGLEEVGVETDPDGAIVLDRDQRTSVPSIFAAGVTTSHGSSTSPPAASGSTSARCHGSSSPPHRSPKPG